MSWRAGREKALRQLREHLSRGRVDEDIIPLLDAINSIPWLYTTSSCSGRIQLAASPLPGDKGVMRIIAKWHRPVNPAEVEAALRGTREPDLWLAVHQPILHVAAESLEAGRRVLVLARNTGFKHSGIQGLGGRYMVEIMSMEKMEAPLRLRGVDLIDPALLPYIVEAADKMLRRAKERLRRLEAAFAALAEEQQG